MIKRNIKPLVISITVLLLLCFLFMMLPLENSKTVIGIALIGITDKNVVMHPLYKNTYIVKAVDGSENGYDIFVEYMREKGYLLKERLGSIFIFQKNSEKLVLVSAYKNHRLLDDRQVILFNP